jgi:hypothetical protein
VCYALRTVSPLIIEWEADRPQYSRVAADSIVVAREFDRLGATPLGAHSSWVAFELAGEADLAERVFQERGVRSAHRYQL